VSVTEILRFALDDNDNYSFKNAVSGEDADATIPVAVPPNPAS
jgi:hypothetical protein